MHHKKILQGKCYIQFFGHYYRSQGSKIQELTMEFGNTILGGMMSKTDGLLENNNRQSKESPNQSILRDMHNQQDRECKQIVFPC